MALGCHDPKVQMEVVQIFHHCSVKLSASNNFIFEAFQWMLRLPYAIHVLRRFMYVSALSQAKLEPAIVGDKKR
jgi:hypothetical protein